ncbi:imidazole glycerol phosphate synthase subunit HisF [Simkania negevensis]|uniref:imidazole glycerol-phosphate synthase n=1 Tax=Simkania negevensis TaxID=83561 RepID=A0ABS3AR56_9BACT|nr:imidazole glycerol phosphate synthase subunit HisF [Simkania negevensis]
MLRTRVIPCLLLRNSSLVKTERFSKPRYLGDPINAVKIFNDKGADELVFLDISATEAGREPAFDLVASIASECFMPFAYGGGISTLEHAKKLIELGAEKVILNHAAIKNPQLVTLLAKELGSQSVVVSIDAKKNLFGSYKVFIKRGTTNTKRSPVELAKEMEERGAGEIFLNAIHRDGTMQGYDLDLIQEVASQIEIPLVASGGAGALEDFSSAQAVGASGVSAGAFFVYQGVHKAFLIHYPPEEALQELLGESSAYAIP